MSDFPQLQLDGSLAREGKKKGGEAEELESTILLLTLLLRQLLFVFALPLRASSVMAEGCSTATPPQHQQSLNTASSAYGT